MRASVFTIQTPFPCSFLGASFSELSRGSPFIAHLRLQHATLEQLTIIRTARFNQSQLCKDWKLQSKIKAASKKTKTLVDILPFLHFLHIRERQITLLLCNSSLVYKEESVCQAHRLLYHLQLFKSVQFFSSAGNLFVVYCILLQYYFKNPC